MNLDALFAALLGAGGATAIGSAISGFRLLRKGKLDDEETLIKRLDASNKEQSERAREAEKRADNEADEATKLRRERDQALEYAARLRRQLIDGNIEPAPRPEGLL